MTNPEAAATGRAREYETIYVLRADASRESCERISSRVEAVVGREGGRLTLVENWGRRQLAYAVGKRNRGIYVYVKYVGGGRLVAEIERNLRMLDEVLKFQTVRVRDAVNLSTLEVNPEDVKFEAVEPVAEDDADESWARTLGLEEPTREAKPPEVADRAEEPAEAVAAEDTEATSTAGDSEEEEKS
jgi:small subunit ribosomal protein S6